MLTVKGDKQFAAKGRQPAEFLWSALQVVQLAKEWKKDAYTLKLDIRKAFDTVSRFRLAQKVIQSKESNSPYEVRCLLRMLMSREVVLSLPWGEHAIDANVGVKQGATESPLLLVNCWMMSYPTSSRMRWERFFMRSPLTELVSWTMC